MAFDVKNLLDFIMPLVQDGKEEEAKDLITQHASAQESAPAKRAATENEGGGLLGALGGLFGDDKKDGVMGVVGNLLDGGAGDLLGGLLGEGGFAALLPKLLELIKPGKADEVTRFITGLLGGEDKPTAPKRAGSTAKAEK